MLLVCSVSNKCISKFINMLKVAHVCFVSGNPNLGVESDFRSFQTPCVSKLNKLNPRSPQDIRERKTFAFLNLDDDCLKYRNVWKIKMITLILNYPDVALKVFPVWFILDETYGSLPVPLNTHWL